MPKEPTVLECSGYVPEGWEGVILKMLIEVYKYEIWKKDFEKSVKPA
jgi:hypothetical protein